MMIPRTWILGVGRTRAPSLYQLTAIPGRVFVSQRSFRTLPGSKRRCSVVSSFRSSRTSVQKTHCAAFINLIFFYTCTFIHLFDIILVLHESPSLDSILPLLSQASQLWPPSPQLHYLPSHKLTQWNYHGDLKALLTQPSSTHPSSSSFLSLCGLLGERSTKHCKVTQEKEEKKHRARETEANEHVATWQWTESKSEGRWRFAGDLRGWGEESGVQWSLEKGDGCVWSQTGGSESFLLLLLL